MTPRGKGEEECPAFNPKPRLTISLTPPTRTRRGVAATKVVSRGGGEVRQEGGGGCRLLQRGEVGSYRFSSPCH